MQAREKPLGQYFSATDRTRLDQPLQSCLQTCRPMARHRARISHIPVTRGQGVNCKPFEMESMVQGAQHRSFPNSRHQAGLVTTTHEHTASGTPLAAVMSRMQALGPPDYAMNLRRITRPCRRSSAPPTMTKRAVRWACAATGKAAAANKPTKKSRRNMVGTIAGSHATGVSSRFRKLLFQLRGRPGWCICQYCCQTPAWSGHAKPRAGLSTPKPWPPLRSCRP